VVLNNSAESGEAKCQRRCGSLLSPLQCCGLTMNRSCVETIVRALNDQQVQYLIAGGLAVVAHGYVRFTADVDLMLAVDQANLIRAVGALSSLGYIPRAPVQFEEFINPAARKLWAEQKNMTVFSLFSPQHSATEIDLFLEPPIDFPRAIAAAKQFEIAPGIFAPFCSIDDLIAMKLKVGRPQDHLDAAELRRLKQ
jgi:hypothetical protein